MIWLIPDRRIERMLGGEGDAPAGHEPPHGPGGAAAQEPDEGHDRPDQSRAVDAPGAGARRQTTRQRPRGR